MVKTTKIAILRLFGWWEFVITVITKILQLRLIVVAMFISPKLAILGEDSKKIQDSGLIMISVTPE